MFNFQINRDISLQSFLTKNKVFSEVVQYEFESCKNDKVTFLFSQMNSLFLLGIEDGIDIINIIVIDTNSSKIENCFTVWLNYLPQKCLSSLASNVL